jgi:hypothetical protein
MFSGDGNGCAHRSCLDRYRERRGNGGTAGESGGRPKAEGLCASGSRGRRLSRGIGPAAHNAPANWQSTRRNALIQLWREAGIDLPLRFLAWKDGAGLSSVIYADPLWLANAREQRRGDRACSEGGRSIRTSRAVPISPPRRGAFATCAFVMSACRPVDWLPIRRPRHRNGGVLAGTSVRKSHHLDVQRQVQRQI